MVTPPKSNVIAFPVVKRPEPTTFKEYAAAALHTIKHKRDAYNKQKRAGTSVVPFDPEVWPNSQKMQWASYIDMLKDVIVDIHMGRLNPSGMFIAVVDNSYGISAMKCFTLGLTREDVEDVCYDIMDSNNG